MSFPLCGVANEVISTCRDHPHLRVKNIRAWPAAATPLDEPMAFDLIERIVKLRVKQDGANAAAKRKK